MSFAVVLTALLFPGLCRAEVEYGWGFERDGLNAPPDSYYVEQDCVYWVTTLPPLTGSSQYYEIRGEYANARFSSFQSYGEISPFDTIYDSQIDPNEGSINPIREEVPCSARRQRLRYTIRVLPLENPSNLPDARPANTLYVKPRRSDGRYGLIYRVYWNKIKDNAQVPKGYTARQWEKQGQQELPRIFFVAESTLQEQKPGPVSGVPYPRTRLTEQTLQAAAGVMRGTADEPDWFAGNPNFPYANAAAGYFMANLDDRHGNAVTIRFKAPTFPDTEGGELIDPDSQQTRYWSVCTHIPGTTTTIDCMSDHEFVIDDDGWVTIIVSAPDKKPAEAINWLPFGWDTVNQRYGASVIIRHLLPSDVLLPESPYFYVQGCLASYSTSIVGFRSCLNNSSALADFSGDYCPDSTYN